MAKEETTDEVEESKVDVEGETPDEITKEEPTKEEAESQDTDEKDEFEKRFPQFKGETVEEYTQRLEDAYDKSTTEGRRLAEENETLKSEKLGTIANPDENIPEDSFGDKYARTQVRKDNRAKFEEFAEEHGELKTDPALAQRLKSKVGVLAKVAVEEEGEIPDMGELLRGAWAMIAPPSSNTETRTAYKETVGSSKTTTVKKRDSKAQFSPAQIAAAKKMYPSKSNKELESLLGKYTN